MLIITEATALDVAYNSSVGGAMGISFLGESEQFSVSYTEEHGVTNMDTQCMADNQAVNVPDANGLLAR